MWVHTCSLDHKHALQTYRSKGFEIFKEEEIILLPNLFWKLKVPFFKNYFLQIIFNENSISLLY